MAIQVKYIFDPSINSNASPSISGGGTKTTTDVTNADGTITRTIAFTSNPNRVYFGNNGSSSKAIIEVLEYPFNTSMTSFYYLFDGCTNLKNICGNDLSSWDVSNISDMDYAFRNCKKLPELNLSGWKLDQTDYRGSFLANCSSMTKLTLNGWTTGGQSISGMLGGCTALKEVNMENCTATEINYVIAVLPTVTGGVLNISGVDNEANVNKSSAESKGWTARAAVRVAEYTFNSGTDTLPIFNDGYGYTYEDVDNGDGTITRTIFPGDGETMPSSISFYDKTGLVSLSYLDTSNVTDMNNMFYRCTSLTSLDLSSFNTSNVTNMSRMFFNCKNLTSLDLSNFDTSNVTDMSWMFYECNNLTSLDVSSFDTSEVTNMFDMFYRCMNLTSLDVSNFNTSNVTDMRYMFYECNSLTSLNLSNFDTSNVTGMDEMFAYSTNLTSLDLSNFDTSKVNDMNEMLYNCSNLVQIKITNSDSSTINKFISALPLRINETVGRLITYPVLSTEIDTVATDSKNWDIIDAINIIATYTMAAGGDFYPAMGDFVIDDTSDVVNDDGTITRSLGMIDDSLPTSISFKDKTGLVSLSYLNTSNVTDMEYMFYNCSNLTSLDLSSFNTSNVTDMTYMFYKCSNLTSLDVSNFNTSKVTDMSYMFYTCTNLTSLDLSSFDTSKVTTMRDMFSYCNKLTSLDLSNFDTSKVTTMSAMFFECNSLTTIEGLSNFNTSKVNNMEGMFGNCTDLTSLDLSSFNTSEVTDMSSMFGNCKKITSLDLSSFDTSKVTDMRYMFQYCQSLTSLNVSSFNTSKVTTMGGMFSCCNNLKSLDLSSFDTSRVTNMYEIFYGCNNLHYLTLSDNFYNTTLTPDLPVIGNELLWVDLSNMSSKIINKVIGTLPDKTGTNTINVIKTVGSYNVTEPLVIKPTSVIGTYANNSSINLTNAKNAFDDYENTCMYFSTTSSYSSSNSNRGRLDFTFDTSNIPNELPEGVTVKLECIVDADYNDIQCVFNDGDGNQILYTALSKNSPITKSVDITNNYKSILNMDGNGKPGYMLITGAQGTNFRLYDIKVSFEGYNIESTINEESANNKGWNIEREHVIAEYTFDSSLGDVLPVMHETRDIEIELVDNTVYFAFGPLDVSEFNVTFSGYEGNECELTIVKDDSVTYDLYRYIYTYEGTTVAYCQFTSPMKGVWTFRTFYEGFNVSYNGVDTYTTFTDYNYIDSDEIDGLVHRKITSSNILPSNISFDSQVGLISIDRLDLTNVKVPVTFTADGEGEEASIFSRCTNLIEINNVWGIFQPYYITNMFMNCSSLTNIDISDWVACDINLAYQMFDGCTSLEKINMNETILIPNDDFYYDMFKNCNNLVEINLDRSTLGTVNLVIDLVPTRPSDDTGLLLCRGVIGDRTIINKQQANDKYWNVEDMYKIAEYIFNSGTDTLPTFNDEYMYITSDVDNGNSTITRTIVSETDIPTSISFKDKSGLVSVSYLDTSKVTDMSYMFYNCSNLTSLDLSSFDTSNVTNMSNMFNICTKLLSIDVSNFNTSKVTDMSYMFSNCKMTTIDVSNFNTSKVTNMKYMFNMCSNLTSLDLSNFNTSNVTDMSNMFYECTKLTTIDGLSEFVTNNLTNMSWMFYNCYRITALDLSSFDTSKVTDMSNMFDSCTNLTSLDLSSFNTSIVTNMKAIFYSCSKLTSLDLSNWNTGNVTNMSKMFQNCTNLTSLDLSSFDTSKVTDMSYMFYQCRNLITIDVSNFNTSKVTDMNQMFRDCNKLTSLDLSGFNTSIVTNMNSMFYECNNLKLIDLSSFNTSKVSTNVQQMFHGCNNLHYLTLSDNFYNNATITPDLSEIGNELLWVDLSNMSSKNINKAISVLPNKTGTNTINVIKTVGSYNVTEPVVVKPTSSLIKYADGSELSLANSSNIYDDDESTYGSLNTGSAYGSSSTNRGAIYFTFDTSNIPNELPESGALKLIYKIKANYTDISCKFMDGDGNQLDSVTLSTSTLTRTIDITNNYKSILNMDGNGKPGYMLITGATGTNFYLYDIKIVLEGSNGVEITINEESANSKGWNIEHEHVIAEYTFDSSIGDVLPVMNKEYEFNDIIVGSITTRKITSLELPTQLSFNGCTALTCVNRVDLTDIVDSSNMFNGCNNLSAISNIWGPFSPSKVSGMFNGCASLTNIELSDWVGVNIKETGNLFKNCTNIEYINMNEQMFNIDDTGFISGCNNLEKFDLNKSVVETVNAVITELNIRPSNDPGTLYCVGMLRGNISDINKQQANDKYWNVEDMYKIAEYIFNSGTDTLPTFNSGFTYEYTNINNGDGTMTRTIKSGTGLPTSISFSGKTGLVSLSYLDTSNVTDMSDMFKKCSNLTSVDLSSFNTSNVTSMSDMFNDCYRLTSLDVSNFNTSKVTNMKGVFANCFNLTTIEGLTNWNTGNVINMHQMFYGLSTIISLDLSSFDTTKVNDMEEMFYSCDDLTTLNICNFNTAIVRENNKMGDWMFIFCSNLISVNMSNSDADSIDSIINVLPKRTAKNPGELLTGVISAEECDISTANSKYWNIKDTVVVKYIFDSSIDTLPNFNEGFEYIIKDIDNGDGTTTRKIAPKISVELLNSVSFNGCEGLVSLSKLDVGNLTNMNSMFRECINLTSLDLSSLDTANVTNMNNIFYGCTSLMTLDISGWNTSKVTNMYNMFNGCAELNLVKMQFSDTNSINMVIEQLPTRTADSYGKLRVFGFTGDGEINTTTASNKYWHMLLYATLSYKFDNKVNFLPTFNDEFTYIIEDVDNGDGTTNRLIINEDGLSPTVINLAMNTYLLEVYNIDGRGLTDASNLFASCLKLTLIDLSNFDSSNITNMWSMFSRCYELTAIKGIEKLNVSNVTQMGRMFYDCRELTSLDLSGWDTSKVNNMEYMFYYCNNLTSLDLSSFDTANVTNMNNMFYNCYNLASLDVSSFDTSKVNYMEYMFSGCNNLTSLDLSSFNTSIVTNMGGMFNNCSSLTSLDLSSFNTSNATRMGYMFYNCKNLTSLDLSNFNTSNVTTMNSMFEYCTNLTSLDVSSFDTSKVTSMYCMFQYCYKLTSLDLSNFDIGKITDMEYMFSVCSNLTSLDLSNFDTSKVTDMDGLFYGCSNLRSIKMNDCNTLTINSMITVLSTVEKGVIYNLTGDINAAEIELILANSKNWKICTRLGRISKHISVGERYL